MKREKIFCLCIAVLLVFGLAGCGTERKDDSAGDNLVQKSDEVESSGSQTDNVSSSVGNSDSDNQEMKDTGNADVSGSSNILIAYFSVPEDVETTDAVAGASIVVRDDEKMGNTEYVAKMIQQTIGGDLFRIETVEEYPLDHDPLVDQAAEEQDENKRPELLNHVENFEQYETIILGYPNWWADLPMPVYTFLEEYDFGGKTIIPFVTHGGSGFSGTIRTISELHPDAHVSENTLSLSRNSVADSEEDVASWAESLGLNVTETIPENSGDAVAGSDSAGNQVSCLYVDTFGL